MSTAVQQPDLVNAPPPSSLERFTDGGHDGEVVCLHEYLTTSYSPDCEYVDGHLEERNLGEYDHNRIQKRILLLLARHEEEWNVESIPEQRLQVSPSNYRVPDVMVLRADHTVDRIVREAPLVVIEVLSPEDTMKRLLEKVKEYLNMGVGHIWAFDPSSRVAYRCDANGFHRVEEAELTLPDSPLRLNLADVFQVLDKK